MKILAWGAVIATMAVLRRRSGPGPARAPSEALSGTRSCRRSPITQAGDGCRRHR